MMEWAAIVVAEPGNVAHVFAKDVWECQKTSGLRPEAEGCSVTPFFLSIFFGSAYACTANGQMSALVYLSWLEVSSFLRRSKCVPSGSTPPRARTTSGMPWTDCRADIGTRVGM